MLDAHLYFSNLLMVAKFSPYYLMLAAVSYYLTKIAFSIAAYSAYFLILKAT